MSEVSLEVLQDKLQAAAETLNIVMDLSFKSMFGGISGYIKGMKGRVRRFLVRFHITK